MSDIVVRLDVDALGWLWLDNMVSAICDEEPSDIAYSADQMVDAYIAGAETAPAEITRLRAENEKLREALECIAKSGARDIPAMEVARAALKETSDD